jgi:hypothetical protein
VVKDMDFKPDVFEPMLSAAVGEINRIIGLSVSGDTILKMLDLMSHLMTEMSQKVLRLSSNVKIFLPYNWSPFRCGL